MARSSGGRTIVLGIDSVDLVLVERWVAQGLLPFFAKMLRNGPLVRLSAVSRVLQGALWPSLLSGRSPGHHGNFYLTQLTTGTYDVDTVKGDRVPLDAFYDRLSAHGVRCAIVDIPNDMPKSGFKGLQIVDWLTEFQQWQFAAQPAASKREIEHRLGALSRTGGYGPTVDSIEGHRLLRQRLEKGLAMKSTLTQELLDRNDLDHIFVVFAEAHKAGHFLWKYMDATHPDHVAAEPYLRDAIQAIYVLLDRQLAQLSRRLRPQDDLIVFSDHGMRPNYRGDHFVGTILERLGLCPCERASRLDIGPTRSRDSTRVMSRMRRAMRGLISTVVPTSVDQRLRRQFGAAARIDWSRTQAFSVPTDRNSYLRLNVRGREPEGIVARGGAYADLVQFIGDEFRALVNAETGKPAVEEIFNVHELYPGPCVDDLPDIAILWHSDAPINILESPRLGRMSIRVRENRSGNHRAEGFLLAQGPSFRSQRKDLHGDILQIPPTLLALHGVPRPDDSEMPPLNDLLVGDSSWARRDRVDRVAALTE